MNINGTIILRAAVAAVLVSAPSHSALAAGVPALIGVEAELSGVISPRVIAHIRATANGYLLAIGRVDSISMEQSELFVLGNKFRVIGTPRAQSVLKAARVGDSVALFGELTEFGYFVSAGALLSNQYVPGASYVYLRGYAEELSATSDRYAIGSQGIVVGDLASSNAFEQPKKGDAVEIIGTQPSIGGLVLAAWQGKADSKNDGAWLDASVGTGWVDASVGTGKVDASVGTGWVDASVGTGKVDASVGTGKVDASVGTGKVDASVGTGKVDASVGTGKVDASVGTGKVDASVGTGKVDASVGTGHMDNED